MQTISIDGPVAAGKTAVGKLLAQRLGYRFIDTGAMYRAITWLAIKHQVDLSDAEALGALAGRAAIDISGGTYNSEQTVKLNGCNVTKELRRPEVEAGVSLVSRLPGVRKAMVTRQRRMAEGGEMVMAGRDIGTVVLPQADLKIFLSASPTERARRRHLELSQAGQDADYQVILSELLKRDRLDMERSDSPLKPAEDARVIDTDHLSMEEVVSLILKMVESR